MGKTPKPPECENPLCPGHKGPHTGMIEVEPFGPFRERKEPLHFGSIKCLRAFVASYLPPKEARTRASQVFDEDLQRLEEQKTNLNRVRMALKAAQVTSREALLQEYPDLSKVKYIGPAALPVFEWLVKGDGPMGEWLWETMTGLPAWEDPNHGK